MLEIGYKLIRSRRKSISITVCHDASVVVRAPLRAPNAEIAEFVKQKNYWIIEKQKLALRRAELHKPSEPANGEEFPYMGRRLLLAATDKVTRIEAVGGTLAFPRAWLPEAEARLRKWYRARASEVLNERLDYWCGRTGIHIASARLSDARRRWGSCSGSGSLNFTWRLVMAPVDAIDYVVVHELAHIEHHNHSRAFWARVGEIMPDYRESEKWLKENCALLNLL